MGEEVSVYIFGMEYLVGIVECFVLGGICIGRD